MLPTKPNLGTGLCLALLSVALGTLAYCPVVGRSNSKEAPAERKDVTYLKAELVKELLPVLIEGLKDSNAAHRRTAARALWSLGRQVVPALSETLKGSDKRLKQEAIELLGQLGRDAEAALPALLETYRKTGEDNDIRDAALRAISEIVQSSTGRRWADKELR